MTSISETTIEQPFSVSIWLKAHFCYVWWLVLLFSLMPAGLLGWQLRHGTLGANPLQALQQSTGQWALVFLLITLAITPLRRGLAYACQKLQTVHGKRLGDWNWIIRLRRMLGLLSCGYASLHVLVWLHLDIAYDWPWAIEEILEKYYLLFGLAGFLLLIPLALTSNNKSIRLLGRNWRRLHRSVYLILVVVVAHYWLGIKPGTGHPWLYSGLACALLGYRLFAHCRSGFPQPSDDGMEVAER